MNNNQFKIKTEVFEGPMDLLLLLIEKRKLFINDVSLANVADDFIFYLQNKEMYFIKDISEFLIIASTLLLIKSKSLLPSLNFSEEEKKGVQDLELKLKIYKKIKELSISIKNNFGKQIIFFPNARKTEIIFSSSPEINKENLSKAIFEVIKNLPKFEVKPNLKIKKVISLEEMINNLTKKIQISLKLSFKDFSGIGKEEKINVIISFLAMLELVKQGIIEVNQREKFEDIHIETKNVNVPVY